VKQNPYLPAQTQLPNETMWVDNDRYSRSHLGYMLRGGGYIDLGDGYQYTLPRRLFFNSSDNDNDNNVTAVDENVYHFHQFDFTQSDCNMGVSTFAGVAIGGGSLWLLISLFLFMFGSRIMLKSIPPNNTRAVKVKTHQWSAADHLLL
jgi:hypothetical protein